MSVDETSAWLTEGIDIESLAEEQSIEPMIMTLSAETDEYGVMPLAEETYYYTVYYTDSYGYSNYNNYSNVYSNNYYNYSRYQRDSYTDTYARYQRDSYTNAYAAYQRDSYTNAYVAYQRDSGYNNYSNYNNYANYSVAYTNAYTVYSNTVSIVSNPVSVIVEDGQSITFSISVSDSSVVSGYQWYVSTSASGTGSAINGATSASYSFIASEGLNGQYYYCVVTAVGNTATSARAQLTVKMLDCINMSVAVNEDITLFARLLPVDATIQTCTIKDNSIATVSNNKIYGISVGETVLTITTSYNITKEITITVCETPLEVVLNNLASSIKRVKNISNNIYLNQFVNILDSGSIVSKNYDSLDKLFDDIGKGIRNITGLTELIYPKDFYINILNIL